MGTLVKATADHNTKPNYAVTTPLAGAVAVADGEFAVFVGSTVGSQLEAYNGIEKCMEALREAGWPNPITSQLSYAHYDTVQHDITVGNGVAPTLTEDMVAVLQGLDFTVEGKLIVPEDELVPLVKGDGVELEEVFVNLIQNAVNAKAKYWGSQ